VVPVERIELPTFGHGVRAPTSEDDINVFNDLRPLKQCDVRRSARSGKRMGSICSSFSPEDRLLDGGFGRVPLASQARGARRRPQGRWVA